jgi:DNA-binding GntR family transcriptional regulator
VRNGCFVRQAIECAVVRRAAGMVNDEQLYQLEQNLNQQRTAVERQQLTDFSSWMMNFTRSSQIADCQLAWDTVENIKATIDRVRYMSLDHVTPPDMMLRQHHDIFQPLVARNPDAVEKAMRLHLQEISESVLLVRQENSDWFSEE